MSRSLPVVEKRCAGRFLRGEKISISRWPTEANMEEGRNFEAVQKVEEGRRYLVIRAPLRPSVCIHA